MNLEERVRETLVAISGKLPSEPLQDLVFAAGLIATDHAFALLYRLW